MSLHFYEGEKILEEKHRYDAGPQEAPMLVASSSCPFLVLAILYQEVPVEVPARHCWDMRGKLVPVEHCAYVTDGANKVTILELRILLPVGR
jgi:hypothetical protein